MEPEVGDADVVTGAVVTVQSSERRALVTAIAKLTATVLA